MEPVSDNDHDFIRVSAQDFDLKEEYDSLIQQNTTDGAVVFFVGLVRDYNQNEDVEALFLEHYPKMTEKSLNKILKQARENWQLGRIRLIHRIGQLKVNEQIVFVGVSSPHREESFSAAQFIMDYLKTEAPFWKKESLANGTKRWVEAEQKNAHARKKWQK